jgi:hypothetical protein
MSGKKESRCTHKSQGKAVILLCKRSERHFIQWSSTTEKVTLNKKANNYYKAKIILAMTYIFILGPELARG